jgi:hypothetical protein
MAVAATPCQTDISPQRKTEDLQNELQWESDGIRKSDTSATGRQVVDGARQMWHLVIDANFGITGQRLPAIPAAITISRHSLLNRY